MKVDACLSTGESKETIYPNQGWDAAAVMNMGFPKGWHLLTFLFLEKKKGVLTTTHTEFFQN